MPPACELVHWINSVDESAPAPCPRQFHISKEEEQAIQDNIDTYLMKGQIRPLTN